MNKIALKPWEGQDNQSQWEARYEHRFQSSEQMLVLLPGGFAHCLESFPLTFCNHFPCQSSDQNTCFASLVEGTQIM